MQAPGSAMFAKDTISRQNDAGPRPNHGGGGSVTLESLGNNLVAGNLAGQPLGTITVIMPF